VVRGRCNSYGGSRTLFDCPKAVGDRTFPGDSRRLDVLVGFAKNQGFRPAGGAPGRVRRREGHALKHLGNPALMGKDPAAALKGDRGRCSMRRRQSRWWSRPSSPSRRSHEDDWFEYVGIFLDADGVGMVKAAVDGLRRFTSARVMAGAGAQMRAGPRAIRLAVRGASGRRSPPTRCPAAGRGARDTSQIRCVRARRSPQAALDGREAGRLPHGDLALAQPRRERAPHGTEIIRSVPDPISSSGPS